MSGKPPSQSEISTTPGRLKAAEPRGVLDQNGLKFFIIVMALSIFSGIVVARSLSTVRITRHLKTLLSESDRGFAKQFSFASASVSLADGWLPQVALNLDKLEWRTEPECQEEAPIKAKRVHLPIRVSALLSSIDFAELRLGSIRIEDLVVDIDAVQNGCGQSKTPRKSTPVIELAAKPSVESNSQPVPQSFRPNWDFAQQVKNIESILRPRLDAVEFARAELFFEKRMKSVVLEEMGLKWDDSRDEGASNSAPDPGISLEATVRLPPASVFGESLPLLFVKGQVKGSRISGDVRADLNEGTLEASAVLRPVLTSRGEPELESEIHMGVSDLPLSVINPLFVKSGLVGQEFHPKFAWLDCEAEIKGLFSRLVVDNPVRVNQCELSGAMGRLRMESGTRYPTGQWGHLDIVIENLDLRKAMDSFGIGSENGSEGAASDSATVASLLGQGFQNLGIFNGKAHIENTGDAVFTGRLTGVGAKFSSEAFGALAGNPGMSAIQNIELNRIDGRLKSGVWDIQSGPIKFDGGETDLSVNLNLEPKAQRGTVRANGSKIKLNSRVERVVFSGPVESMKLKIESKLNSPKSGSFSQLSIHDLDVKLEVDGVRGTEIQSDQIRIDGKFEKRKATSPERLNINVESKNLLLSPKSWVFKLVKPSFFDWRGPNSDGELWRFDRVLVKGAMSNEGFVWDRAVVDLKAGHGKMNLIGRGRISNATSAKDLEMEYEALYPNQKRLKWKVSGPWLNTSSQPLSPELLDENGKPKPPGEINAEINAEKMGLL